MDIETLKLLKHDILVFRIKSKTDVFRKNILIIIIVMDKLSNHSQNKAEEQKRKKIYRIIYAFLLYVACNLFPFKEVTECKFYQKIISVYSIYN